jgi:hypothetical protein
MTKCGIDTEELLENFHYAGDKFPSILNAARSIANALTTSLPHHTSQNNQHNDQPDHLNTDDNNKANDLPPLTQQDPPSIQNPIEIDHEQFEQLTRAPRTRFQFIRNKITRNRNLPHWYLYNINEKARYLVETATHLGHDAIEWFDKVFLQHYYLKPEEYIHERFPTPKKRKGSPPQIEPPSYWKPPTTNWQKTLLEERNLEELKQRVKNPVFKSSDITHVVPDLEILQRFIKELDPSAEIAPGDAPTVLNTNFAVYLYLILGEAKYEEWLPIESFTSDL